MNGFSYLFGKEIVLGISIYILVWPISSKGQGTEAGVILNKMKESYTAVEDYQTDVLVRRYDSEGELEERRFIYTFKRPGKIRIDFHSPHSGMVLLYANDEGKVVVRPFPWIPFIELKLDRGSSLINDPSGQRIDQTHIGLLIRNIERSLTGERRGKPVVEESA